MDIGAQIVGPCFHLCKQTGDLRVKTPGFPLAKILHISGITIFHDNNTSPPPSLNMLVVGELSLCNLQKCEKLQIDII